MSPTPPIWITILGTDYHARSELAQMLLRMHGDCLNVIDLDHDSETETSDNGTKLLLERPELKNRKHLLEAHIHGRTQPLDTIAISGFCRTCTELNSLHISKASAPFDRQRSFFIVLKTRDDQSYDRHVAVRKKDQRVPMSKECFERTLEVNGVQLSDVSRVIKGHLNMPLHDLAFETGKEEKAAESIMKILKGCQGFQIEPCICDSGLSEGGPSQASSRSFQHANGPLRSLADPFFPLVVAGSSPA